MKTLSSFLLLLVLFFSIQGIEDRISMIKGAWVDPPRETPLVWSPEVVKIVTFGMLATAVDWFWIRAIQDPSYVHVLKGQHAPAFYDIDLATKLDPAFYLGYWAGSSILAIVRDDVEGARQILERGEIFRNSILQTWPEDLVEKHWPNQWQVLIMLGYIYTFELKNLIEGVKYYRAAANTRGAGASLKSLGSQLENPDGAYVVGKRVLNSLIAQSEHRNDPPEAKEKLKRQFRSLDINHFLFNLNLEWTKEKIRTPTALNSFLIRKGIVSDNYNGKLHLDSFGKIDSMSERDRTVMGIKN